MSMKGSNISLSRILKVLVTVVAVLVTEKICAEKTPDLVTDRPDQTESSVTISPGNIQIEIGVNYSDEDENGQRSRTIEVPGTLIRVGFTDRIELRLGFDGWIREDVHAEKGYGDTELGTKIYLWSELGWRPEAALLTSLSLPTGEQGFSSERADPSFRFLLAHTLTDRLSAGYNLGMAWKTNKGESGDRDTLSVFQYTATVGIGLTDRLGTFVEFFGDVPINARGTPANSFDTGFTYLVLDNLQLDISAGIGLSDGAEDWFVGLGISYRFK